MMGFFKAYDRTRNKKNPATNAAGSFRYLIELILAGCSPAEPASASFDSIKLNIKKVSINSRIKYHCKVISGLL